VPATADADPNVLPLTSADHVAVADAQTRAARVGGHVWIDDKAGHVAVYITEPGSRMGMADWTGWREPDGIHAERLPHGVIYLASDIQDLLDCVIGGWEAAADAGPRRCGNRGHGACRSG
jgi:hypothetical protein